jgi:hypothetical protein
LLKISAEFPNKQLFSEPSVKVVVVVVSESVDSVAVVVSAVVVAVVVKSVVESASASAST